MATSTRILLVALLGIALVGCDRKPAAAPDDGPTPDGQPATDTQPPADAETPAPPTDTPAPPATDADEQAPPGDEQDTPAVASVTGTVFYRQRIALTPDAVVTVKLADVSLQDVAAVIITEQVIHPAGKQVPFAFQLDYDPAEIDPAHTYAVQVRIEDGGRLMFINTSAYHVITRDNPTEVDVMVDMVR